MAILTLKCSVLFPVWIDVSTKPVTCWGHMRAISESVSVNFLIFYIQSINLFCPFSLIDMPHSQFLIFLPPSYDPSLHYFIYSATRGILPKHDPYNFPFLLDVCHWPLKSFGNDLNSSMYYKALLGLVSAWHCTLNSIPPFK